MPTPSIMPSIDIFDIIVNSNKFFSIILTKVDKCSKNFINEQKESFFSLMNNYPNNFNNIYISFIFLVFSEFRINSSIISF